MSDGRCLTLRRSLKKLMSVYPFLIRAAITAAKPLSADVLGDARLEPSDLVPSVLCTGRTEALGVYALLNACSNTEGLECDADVVFPQLPSSVVHDDTEQWCGSAQPES
jgi:hypothetical protein